MTKRELVPCLKSPFTQCRNQYAPSSSIGGPAVPSLLIDVDPYGKGLDVHARSQPKRQVSSNFGWDVPAGQAIKSRRERGQGGLEGGLRNTATRLLSKRFVVVAIFV